MTGILSACSSVPDAVNPVEWWKGLSNAVSGRETTAVATPRPRNGEFPEVGEDLGDRKPVARGLVGDRDNSRYAAPVRREPAPTKPLARKGADPKAEPQSAKVEPPKVEAPKVEAPKAEPIRTEPPKAPEPKAEETAKAPEKFAPMPAGGPRLMPGRGHEETAAAPVPPAPPVQAQPLPAPQPAPQVIAVAPPAVQPTAPVAEPLPAPAPARLAVADDIPAAAEAKKGEYRPSLDRRMPTARDPGTVPPPPEASTQPPARPDVPEVVPAPAQPRPAKRNTLSDTYQSRLAESAAANSKPLPDLPWIVPTGPAAAPAPAPVAPAFAPPIAPATAPAIAMAPEFGGGIDLIPPKSMRAKAASAGKPARAARGVAPQPSASFQVAAVAFTPGSAALSAAERQAVAEVARVYRKAGGTVRVVGSAPAESLSADPVAQAMGGFDLSMQRANAVAAALTRAGVPAHKILVGAAPGGDSGASGAEVFIDY